jgi:DNA (cytosine-5)-methyltransferase 1
VNRTLTFYEFFAGGGMARLGLGGAWRCLFANDFDPVKVATYRANFGDEDIHEGDVWKLLPADLPGQADLAWASSPCQDFSLAGARAGLAGGRSSAFFGFWRLIEALNTEGRAPRAIVIENVVGLLTSHGGKDFEALCGALAKEGYSFGALEIDAARFTPQSRPRVFVVASRSPHPELTGDSPFHTPAVRAAFERLPAELQSLWCWWRVPAPPIRNTDLAAILEDGAPWRSDADTNHLLDLMSPAHRARLTDGSVGAVFRRTRAAGQRAEVRTDGLAGCLRTPRGGSSRQSIVAARNGDVRSRLLTPREAARLMGLPESYQLPQRTTAALHIVGDGVAVPVVRWLAEQLLEPMLGDAAGVIAAE